MLQYIYIKQEDFKIKSGSSQIIKLNNMEYIDTRSDLRWTFRTWKKIQIYLLYVDLTGSLKMDKFSNSDRFFRWYCS